MAKKALTTRNLTRQTEEIIVCGNRQSCGGNGRQMDEAIEILWTAKIGDHEIKAAFQNRRRIDSLETVPGRMAGERGAQWLENRHVVANQANAAVLLGKCQERRDEGRGGEAVTPVRPDVRCREREAARAQRSHPFLKGSDIRRDRVKTLWSTMDVDR